MHFGHEAVLAHGEGIRKDDVCGREKCAVERHTGWWPDRPVDVVHARLPGLDASSDDRDQNCYND